MCCNYIDTRTGRFRRLKSKFTKERKGHVSDVSIKLKRLTSLFSTLRRLYRIPPEGRGGERKERKKVEVAEGGGEGKGGLEYRPPVPVSPSH